MGLILNIFIYLNLCSALQGVHQLSWLPCRFTDERILLNNLGHTETESIYRDAMLQFGQKGDPPVNPHAITFLITGSKVDLRRYVEGVEQEQIECDLHKYSLKGIHVRWPVQGAKDYNRWFSCTLKHTKGLFTVTSFLRNPSDQPPSGEDQRWPAIADTEILTTTAVMAMKTNSPSVIANLGAQKKLHCQFAIDHKGPNITVEWHMRHRGEKTRLFSHNGRTGQTQGTGVAIKSLTGGEASYDLAFAKMSSEGMYTCSVSVSPLFSSVEITLHIEEAPRVSLNVGPVLSLQEGGEQKVVCEAADYYPLDVEIVWYVQDPAVSGQRVGAPLPKVLKNVLLSSHKHNWDRTFTLASFFYLTASLSDSGKQFTCSVSHQSLRVPIKKSFNLIVEEPSSWIFPLAVCMILAVLLLVLYVMLPILHRARKKTVQKKPY